MKLNDTELNKMLDNIKQILHEKPLVGELEMIIKHLPTYVKIVKTHIIQLQCVIALDNHKNKSLEDINLSPIVKQLMNIFEQLEEDDLDVLEQLHFTASNNLVIENTIPESTITDEVSEATL